MSWLTVPKVVLMTLLVSFVVDVRSDILPYEPVEMLKTHLDKQTSNEESPWSKLDDAGSRELKTWTSIMRKNLQAYLSKVRGVSVMFLRGEDVLAEKLAHGMRKNTSITIPYANLMSLMGVTLPILLESYKTNVLTDPIGQVLKGGDRENPVVKGHEQLSCLDLLNKLPKTGDSYSDVLQDPQLMQALNSHGKLLLYVANTVLGRSAKEAWFDALLSAGMEETKHDQGALITSLNDLAQYVFTLQHGFETGPAAPQSEAYAPDNGRYLFSWWFNCPVGDASGECLLPRLPPGTMFNLSPGLRIYISPHLRLSLIITNSSSASHAKQSLTVADILHEDRRIWNQIYSVLDPTSRDIPPTQETQQEGWTWSGIFYWVWPVLVLLFFILSSHVWVYWMLHAFWYVVGFFVKRTHIPRPKTAKQE